MKLKAILFSLMTVICLMADAQLFSSNKADSLRGTLTPERTCYDVTEYNLHVQVDTASNFISGSNSIIFTAMHDFNTMQVDLFANMNIDSIIIGTERLKFRREFNTVFIQMPGTIVKGQQHSVMIYFSGSPIIAKNAPWDGGFVRTRDKNGRPWITVSCQGVGASLWWPCKDHQSDEPEKMQIHCTVPAGLQCVSNGRELAPTQNGNGTTTFHWSVSYPINTYNVSLNIGDYAHWHDVYQSDDKDTLSLDYYILRQNLDKSKEHFKQVKPMLACYEKYLGKYPFWNDGYALVETPYLGMEHQGAIAYGNKYKKGYMGMDRSGLSLPFDYIIIHESGHEWWGNSVTSSDIADMWIHEGFCTYSEAIYVECMYGYDTAMTYVNALKGTVVNKSPMIGTYGINREGHADMYVKGMLFLNTLRHVIGNDDIWWPMIKNLSDTTFKMQIVDYDRVVRFFNEKTAMNLSPIFEQYVKHGQLPVLEYSIRSRNKNKEMKYRWKSNVAGFQMPVDIYSGGRKIRLQPNQKWQTIKLNEIPEFDQAHFYYRLQTQP